MRTSGPGSSAARLQAARRFPRTALPCSPRVVTLGFTMIELLVVVAIIAIGSAGVAFAMRDSGATQMEREAQRLGALLESARARSRSSGVPVRWRATETGFTFDGLAPGTLPDRWLAEGIGVGATRVVMLGPEPIIGPQQILLTSVNQPGRTLRIATDGLRPFTVQPGE